MTNANCGVSELVVMVFIRIYDGVVWKNFLAPNGNPFLTLPGNYAFQLNVDWFNPFKHTQHSEGAIYLSVLNLPRTERYLHNKYLVLKNLLYT